MAQSGFHFEWECTFKKSRKLRFIMQIKNLTLLVSERFLSTTNIPSLANVYKEKPSYVITRHCRTRGLVPYILAWTWLWSVSQFRTLESKARAVVNDTLTCPCMFMMTTVFDLLHTTKCSGFFGSRWMLFTVISPAPPSDLNVLVHSVDLMLHTLTVPSDEALQATALNDCTCQQWHRWLVQVN